MSNFKQILWMLDNETDPQKFERLCIDLLGREGYFHINPLGGIHDHGRDAEFRAWKDSTSKGNVVVFQFSLQESWRKKLRKDCSTIAQSCPEASALVFVSSRAVTGAQQDELRKEVQKRFGWELTVYGREWFRNRLTEASTDLTKRYFEIEMPPTLSHASMLINLDSLDEESFRTAYPEASPYLAHAALIESTKKEPLESENWHRRARMEVILGRFEDALKSIGRGLKLEPKDITLATNMTQLRAVILAELGIQKDSRGMLIEAKDFFEKTVKQLGRAVDYFNLANVESALHEKENAGQHYRECLKKEPEYAEAWKNLGTILLESECPEDGIACFDKALELKPQLVEAHLSKATAYTHLFDRSGEAVQCFLKAQQCCNDLDERWPHFRYWFADALFGDERPIEALGNR